MKILSGSQLSSIELEQRRRDAIPSLCEKLGLVFELIPVRPFPAGCRKRPDEEYEIEFLDGIHFVSGSVEQVWRALVGACQLWDHQLYIIETSDDV